MLRGGFGVLSQPHIHTLVAPSALSALPCRSNMVSVSNIFLRPVLDMLAKNFLPIPSGKMYIPPLPPLTKAATATNDDAHGVAAPLSVPPPQEPEGNYTLVHDALKQLLAQTPIAIGHLFTALERHFPHKSRNLCEHRNYVANLIAVADYAKAVAEKITVLIVSKLIAIDVEIRLDYEPKPRDLADPDNSDDDTPTTTPATTPATPPNPPTPATVAPSNTAEHPKTTWTIQQQKEHKLADKLDATILLMFNYIRRTCEKGKPKDAKMLVSTFMHLFRRTVLLTHKSKYTQFLIFYLTHFKKDVPDLFVGQMLDCLTDPKAAAISKQSSVAYCASYISRANFLHESTMLSVLNFLLSWAFDWAQTHTGELPSRHRHQMFYTVCQAALYICCFRAIEIVQTKRGAEFLRKWKWRQLLSCSLDPMRFCLESVRREFPKAMLCALGIRLCCEALEGNEDSSRNSSKNDSGGLGRGLNPLDSFFPFDPYLLFQSSAFVHKLYVSWTPIEAPAGMEDDAIFAKQMDQLDVEESDTSSSDDNESADEDDDDMDTMGMASLDPTGMGMGGMSLPYTQRNRCDSFEIMNLSRRERSNSFEALSLGTAQFSARRQLGLDEVEHMVVERSGDDDL